MPHLGAIWWHADWRVRIAACTPAPRRASLIVLIFGLILELPFTTLCPLSPSGPRYFVSEEHHETVLWALACFRADPTCYPSNTGESITDAGAASSYRKAMPSATATGSYAIGYYRRADGVWCAGPSRPKFQRHRKAQRHNAGIDRIRLARTGEGRAAIWRSAKWL